MSQQRAMELLVVQRFHHGMNIMFGAGAAKKDDVNEEDEFN